MSSYVVIYDQPGEVGRLGARAHLVVCHVSNVTECLRRAVEMRPWLIDRAIRSVVELSDWEASVMAIINLNETFGASQSQQLDMSHHVGSSSER